VQVSQDSRASRAKLETLDHKDSLAAQDNPDNLAELETLGILELLGGKASLGPLGNKDLLVFQVSGWLCLLLFLC